MFCWINAVISKIFKYQKEDREDFQAFLSYETRNNPSLNLDDALNLYIKKYNLMIRTFLEEPENISIIRTKLQVMEEMLHVEPEFGKNSQVMDYVQKLRIFINGINSLSPECMKQMKKREQK